MRKSILRLVLLLNFFFVSALLSGLDTGILVQSGNLSFERTRTVSDTGFSGLSFPFSVSTFVNQNISPEFTLHAGFYMDPILRNTILTRFVYKYSFFTLGVGPFFGVFNSPNTLLKSGITTNVRLEIPGIFFLDFRADSSIGGRMVQKGDYIQERSNVSLGYYVPNAICAGNLFIKKYTEKTAKGEVVDNLSEYSFSTDIYQKNAPYKVLLTFGYQSLSKTFIQSETATSHTLGSLFVDTKVDLFIKDILTIVVRLKSSVYTFGQDELVGLSNPGPSGFLFEAMLGATLDIDAVTKE